ncbi:MAG: 1-aminocyclopropane-1-carboxylate deaminase/D-cysteine desulfhydrase [Armatimonadota bacterium]
MRLDDFERFPLAHLPTALEEAPRLAEAVGIERLYIKRDDNTGLALGGNKARKLEYLLADAAAKGADVLLACGGAQSNHVRMTAAAAKKAGMDCILFMPREHPPEEYAGNLLLNALFGAEMRFLPGVHFTDLQDVMAAEAEKLEAVGRRPYIIPLGGSIPLACLGYARAVRELPEIDADAVVAVGTGGTLAGLALGAHLFAPSIRPIGVSVLWKEGEIAPIAAGIARRAAELLGADFEPRIKIHDGYIGEGYAIPTPKCVEAVLLAARTEGLILDPVYTGKAMAGLIDLAKRGEIGKRPVIFWHTGGAPALFASERIFHEEAVRLSHEA